MRKKIHFNIFIRVITVSILLLFSVINTYSQCTGCTQSGSFSGNQTFASGEVYCVTSDSTVSDVTFEDGSTLCVAPGVTFTIQNNINSSGSIAFNVDGTLQFNQSPQFNASTNFTIGDNGLLKAGSSGNNNITFNGSTNTLTNNGTVQVSVLGFQNNSSINTIINYDTFTIGGNINISGDTGFKNEGTISVGQSFNCSSQTIFSSCNTLTTAGFNLNGGQVINTATFTVTNGNIDFGNGSPRFENYGTMNVTGTLNFSGSSSVFYNEGVAILTNAVQGTIGSIEGPSDNSKLGYIKWDTKPSINSGTIGPNLDIEYRPGNNANQKSRVYQNFNGTEASGVSKACEAYGNCTAPQEVTGDTCRTSDGTLPCSLTDSGLTNIVCDNEGTSSRTDDTFTFQLNPTGSETATTYSVSGDVTATNVPYGATTTFGPYLISNGDLTITIIDDGTNEVACEIADITVTAPNIADAIDDTASTSENTAITIDVLNNDIAGDNPISITSVNQPSNGSAVINNNGTPADTSDDTIDYTPNTGFSGTDTFTYVISDGICGSDLASVTITVIEIDNSDFENAMITQAYHNGTTDRFIEITNINAVSTIVTDKLYLALYKDASGDQTNVLPTATLLINSSINAGESVLIKNASSTITNISGIIIDNAAITDFDGANDIIIITKEIGSTAWENRFDVVSNIPNNTSLVRSDEIEIYNKDYTASEWILFIDDDLSTTTNPPERHPHAPLISEIATANSDANIKLGVHKIDKTIRISNAWSNGYPDRSRRVLVNEEVSLSERLSARKLEVADGANLVINNQLLVVTDSVNINTTGEIRLAGTSQFIQTHIGEKNSSGDGKLYVDQNSTVPSYYRYNYVSSPVVTPGSNNYTVASVMKDGTTETSLNSVPKDINFISGYDGNYTNSPSEPIDLAEYWIYTYDKDDSAYNYIHQYSSGTIDPGKGYIFKGPGRLQNYTFVGFPNDGDLTFSVDGNNTLLIGNPYASAINSKRFIEDNLDATTGTLYFWEHAGETNSTGQIGHFSAAYIGGYATRNIALSVSAANVSSNAAASSSLDYTIEAENAVLGGTASKIDNSVFFTQPNDSLTFRNIGISTSVDTLKVTYKTTSTSPFDLYVNQSFIKSFTFPTSTDYSIAKIPLQIQKGDTILLKSTSSSSINIDKVFFTLTFEYASPEQYIAIAQGFFISADSDGGTITFNNSQREFVTEGDDSVFLKSSTKSKISTVAKSNSISILKLGFDYKNSENQSLHRQLGISFLEGNSFGYENGYDSELFDLNATDAYWQFDEIPDVKFVIAGVQEISTDLEVPIHFVVDNPDNLYLGIDEVENIDRTIYLTDKLTSEIYNLTNDGLVQLNLEQGVYEKRFYITFSESVLSVDDELNLSLETFIDNNTNEIVIKNLNDISIKEVSLYNILGQEVGSFKNIENTLENRLPFTKIPAGIYIINIKTENTIISKKVIIE
ncbi:Ig-like domain-containing protein [Polaribacter sp.]|nr:Ig-like domain-containing protein [Polaribacter sp.]